MRSAALATHPAPNLQKALSQKFRADQATAGNAAAIAVGRLWKHGFSIKHARSSWAHIRPMIIQICQKSYAGNQLKGQAYYNSCRMSAGLGPLPDYIHVSLPLPMMKLANTIDPCGLGAFLHQVKSGARMMDAFNSGHDSLEQAVQQLVMSGARDWIEAAARADPDSEGTRRVPGGTCGYCDGLAAMGVSVPDGGWHNDCECTTEPAFNGDTGPSPSIPENDVNAKDTGELDIPDKSWNDTIDFVGNSLNSGKLADADEFLNPDGSVNEAKAIVHFIEQRKSGNPYSLSKSGQPLNKTQTKLLDKFFNKLTGGKPSPVKAASNATDTRVVKSPDRMPLPRADKPASYWAQKVTTKMVDDWTAGGNAPNAMLEKAAGEAKPSSDPLFRGLTLNGNNQDQIDQLLNSEPGQKIYNAKPSSWSAKQEVGEWFANGQKAESANEPAVIMKMINGRALNLSPWVNDKFSWQAESISPESIYKVVSNEPSDTMPGVRVVTVEEIQ